MNEYPSCKLSFNENGFDQSLTPDGGWKNIDKGSGSDVPLVHERLNTLGMMSLGIAHELNGPIATIKACSEGLLKRLSKGNFDPILFKDYLEIIEEEVTNCNFITDNILRFIQEAEEMDKQRIDIHKSLDKTIHSFVLQGRCRRIEIVKKYEKTMPAVSGSECGLRQVFSAVIVNAIEAMKDEGILTLETRIDRNTVCISIKNSGAPIPKENLNKIFEPCYSTKIGHGGTGLGLFLANNIIRNNGGRIQVASDFREGTTFTINLPLINVS